MCIKKHAGKEDKTEVIKILENLDKRVCRADFNQQWETLPKNMISSGLADLIVSLICFEKTEASALLCDHAARLIADMVYYMRKPEIIPFATFIYPKIRLLLQTSSTILLDHVGF